MFNSLFHERGKRRAFFWNINLDLISSLRLYQFCTLLCESPFITSEDLQIAKELLLAITN